VKRDEVALVAAHRHSRQGNEPYVPAYLFKYALDLPEGASAIVLPVDSRIRVLAMTAARGLVGDTVAASPLYAPEITRRSLTDAASGGRPATGR
jgi:alpha-mannosidase